MNRKIYGKIKDGRFRRAPARLKEGSVIILKPSAEKYASQGWKPVVDEKPATDAAHRAVPTGWRENGGRIERVYEIREAPPPPPRVFSKLKVVAALTDAGVWPQVKAWIEEHGFYDLYLAAQEFAEDNEWFAQGLAALKPVVGWTDEQVEALLAKCVQNGEA